MAAPDMLNSSTVFGRTALANVTTVTTTILDNPSASGNLVKVSAMSVSNIDSSNTSEIDVYITRSSIPYAFIKAVDVPVKATIDLVTKSVYLEEGDSIQMKANANNHSQTVISYEVIS